MSVDLAVRLVRSVGFAMRRSRKDLPKGPRRDLIVENLAVALSLLTEIADPTPELVQCGGLDLLAKLAVPAKPASNHQKEPTIELEFAPLHGSEAVHLDVDPCHLVGSDAMDVQTEYMPNIVGSDQPVYNEHIPIPGSGGAPDVAAQNPQPSRAAWLRRPIAFMSRRVALG